MNQYILAHDLGTSGNKATLYGPDGTLRGSMVAEYPTHYPHNGWVEQNADDWWGAVCRSTRALLERSGVSAGEIACVSFSGQMMGCLLVDRDGAPLRNSLIWADTRSSRQEAFMRGRVDPREGYRITGHRLSASNSAAKLLWVKDNEPQVYAKADKLLQAKEYIILKLTGELVTEYSDASGTNLLDIENLQWSHELLEAFEIRRSLLPDLYPSTHIAGKVTAEAARLCGLLEGTPVVIGGGDGCCACVGAGVVEQGKAYCAVGSSSWISMATKSPYLDPEMRTFNFVHLDPALYMPCGAMQAAGYSYAWFRDALCGEERFAGSVAGISPYQLLDSQVEKSPPGAAGLLFLPYLLGERAPWWNHNARGAFVGLGISSSKGDMARAVLEGVGFNLKIILDIFEDFDRIEDVIVIGGGTKGPTWLQILADIWQKPLLIPRYLEEATSMGAAICGGVGVGAFKSFAAAAQLNSTERVVTPNPDNAAAYRQLHRVFCDTYTRLMPTYQALADLSDTDNSGA